MHSPEQVSQVIRETFAGTPYPGDRFIQGSAEGSEPFDEVVPFQGKTSWAAIEPAFLDQRASALSFFSEGGFRFFLPAYLLADLQGKLELAEPLPHLTRGFWNLTVPLTVKGRVFHRLTGRSALMNPLRYGALTGEDHARFRLSIFSREEAGALVAYLELKRDLDPRGFDAPAIDAALERFWRERARSAPTAADIARHLAGEAEYLAAVLDPRG